MRENSAANLRSHGASKHAPWLAVVRVLLVCSACAVALGTAFVALLALTLSVSSDARIEAHLRAGAENGVLLNTSYPLSPFGHGGLKGRPFASAARTLEYDMYTDCIAFGANLGNSDAPLLQRIAASPTAAHEVGACETLVAGLEVGQVHADAGYLRFWHGYQIYFRPLLSVMPLAAFRRLTAILFCSALLFFAWRWERVFGAWVWPIALFPFFALSDFLTVPTVATHALSLTWVFFCAALVPIILERVPNARTMLLPVAVFASGAIYNYLNFLLNPPLAPALIAFVYIAINLNDDARQTRQTVLYALGLAALWFAGFAAAWIEKWLLAVAVLGPDAVLAEIHRTVAKYEATRVRLQVNFLGASRRNVQSDGYFFAYLLGSIAVACAIVGQTIRKRGARMATLLNFAALLVPLLVVVVWVEANRAHSAEHIGFVRRSFVLFSVIPLLAAIKILRDAQRRALA